MKYLLKTSLKHERNWAWYHPGGRHAHIIKKYYCYWNLSGISKDRSASIFITVFHNHYSGLSKEVHNDTLNCMSLRSRTYSTLNRSIPNYVPVRNRPYTLNRNLRVVTSILLKHTFNSQDWIDFQNWFRSLKVTPFTLYFSENNSHSSL